jgi:hypothetical protein
MGGQGGLTTTTTNNTSTAVNPTQPGRWVTVSPLQQQLGTLNNPNTWGNQVPMTPYGETMELKERVKELEYIVQRVVDNYEELQTQYKALQDITKAGENT